jgi:hypothetical protein
MRTFSGASNDTSSTMRSMTVCRRRAPMFSTVRFVSYATRAISLQRTPGGSVGR